MKRNLVVLVIYVLMGGLVACGKPQGQSGLFAIEIASNTLPTASQQPGIQTDPSPIFIVAELVMKSKRAAHTATLLGDGRVLLAGGFASGEQAVTSAELYDPQTLSFSETGVMSTARQSHSATLLPNGKVLVAGGFNGDYLTSAEIYDPTTGQFTPTGSMNEARSGHIAILLQNGKVLLAGGTGIGWSFLATAELYEPDIGSFTATGEMTLPRESHTATLLRNGKVLISGGHQGRRSAIEIYDSAELFDPGTGRFTATGRMGVRRHKHDAVLLADGRVLISGGSDERDSEGTYRSTEIYDPRTTRFTPAGVMLFARYKHTGTSLLLENGQVLFLGGAGVAELFDPRDGVFRAIAGSIEMIRLFATATLLNNGDILFVGGYGSDTSGSAQAWVLRLDPG